MAFASGLRGAPVILGLHESSVQGLQASVTQDLPLPAHKDVVLGRLDDLCKMHLVFFEEHLFEL